MEPAVPQAASQANERIITLWQGRIQNKIYTNWNKPAGLPNESSLAVTILVEVSPDGTLRNPRVKNSSGNVIYDRSVLRPIDKTVSVDQPPIGCPECRDLEITFRPEKE